jgi:hypothetical protein
VIAGPGETSTGTCEPIKITPPRRDDITSRPVGVWPGMRARADRERPFSGPY